MPPSNVEWHQNSQRLVVWLTLAVPRVSHGDCRQGKRVFAKKDQKPDRNYRKIWSNGHSFCYALCLTADIKVQIWFLTLNFKRCELFSVTKEDFQGFRYFFSKKPLPFSFICSIFDSFYLTLCRVLSETLEQWGAVKVLHGYFSLSLKLDITVNSVLVHSPLEGHQFLTTLIFHTLKMKHLIAKETSLWTSAVLSCCIHRKPDIHSSSKRSVNYPHFTLPTTGNSKSKFKIRLCKCFLGRGEGGQEEGVLQFQTNMD